MDQELKERPEFETDEIIVAAWLSMNMREMPRFDWEGEHCYFVFDDGPELRELVKEYEVGNTVASVKEYHMTMTNVRNNMFASRPGTRTRSRARA